MVSDADAELEVVCVACKGTGGDDCDGGKVSCYECGGAGYIPTEAGERLITLMEHHLERLLRAIGRD